MANNVIRATELDFDNIKESLKLFLQNQSEFQDYDFEGSGLSVLLDVLAYNTQYNAFYMNLLANELFLDTAQIRESVVSRAKELGYTPKSAAGAIAFLNMTFTPSGSPNAVTIPKNTEFSSTIDGETFTFVTPTTTTVSANSGSYVATNVKIVEGTPLSFNYTVDLTTSQQFILPNANVDVSSLSVTVQESASNNANSIYSRANNLFAVTANSTVFYLEENSDGFYELKFGNGILGKGLKNGNIIQTEYRICNSDKPNGANTFSGPNSIDGVTTFTISTSQRAYGGTGQETIDSIRFNAPKSFETQNRAVTKEDYKRIVKANFTDVQSVSVYDGGDVTPPKFGKVFLAIKPKNEDVLTIQRKTEIIDLLKDHTAISIDPVLVDPEFVYVIPRHEILFNKDNSTKNASQILNQVVAFTDTFNDNQLGDFVDDFRLSKYVDFIQTNAKNIDSLITNIIAQKRFIPTTGVASNYTISFGKNNISKGSINKGFILNSSPFTFQSKECFLGDDGAGNVIIYTLEGSTKITLVTNVGTIDFDENKVSLVDFNPTGISGTSIKVEVHVQKPDITSELNEIIQISSEDMSITVSDINSGKVLAKTSTRSFSDPINTTNGETTTIISGDFF